MEVPFARVMNLWIIPLVVVAFLGVFTGRRLLHRLNEETVRKAVLVALLFVGIKMFFDNMRNIY
jgi:uncharacterized membrane protein YfcA